MSYLPSPVGITSLDAPLSISSTLTFDTGNPATDTAAKLILEFAEIKYDQVTTINVDVGVTETDNDISAPSASDLVPVYKPSFVPADVQPIAFLIQCEAGEAAIYLATDLASPGAYSDPPDMDSMSPIPLIPGGWFLYADDHLYETADNWQSSSAVPIHVGEIMAAAFLPSRITCYVFSKNRLV